MKCCVNVYFNDNAERKDWVVCPCFLRGYFKHKNRFKVLMFNISYPTEQNNLQKAKFSLTNQKYMSNIADRYSSYNVPFICHELVLCKLVNLQKTKNSVMK